MSDFEKASRLKLRFDTVRGTLTVEDLWEIPLTALDGFSLDEVAKALNRQIKQAETESFVVETTKPNERLQLAFAVVKHIICVRLEERTAERTAASNREKKQRLLELIARKQDESLAQASVEELQAMVAAL